ncbi:hypothetical protein Tco_0074747, partial [Tanacetum coccineum]
VMAFSVISISLDLSEESVGTSTARVILFGTIPTTIPPTTPTIDLPIIHGDTLLTPTISPTIPTIPLVAPTIQYTSPFIDTDLSDNDTPDSPPSQDPKSVGSLPALRLASRYPSDSSSSDSSSRHSSSGYAISDSPDDSSTAAFARPSHKRCRSPTSSIHAVSPVCGALSLVRTDLSPPLKMI